MIPSPLVIHIIMRIFRALGLGLVILILQALMSNVFHAFEYMLVSLFGALNGVFTAVESTASVIHLGI